MLIIMSLNWTPSTWCGCNSQFCGAVYLAPGQAIPPPEHQSPQARGTASRLALGTRSMWELQGETSAAPWRNVGATRGVAIGFGRA
jgi:hypothetical protein